MATVKEGESRLVFIIDKTLHNNFRVRAAEDKLSQKAFIQGVLQGYINDDPNLVEFVQKLTGLSRKNVRKQKRNLQEAEETIKRFSAFDPEEINNIFDVIEKENPNI